MKTLNDSPARYAAQLAETIGSLHRHLAAEQPDWWQQTLLGLHDQLQSEFLFNREYQDAPYLSVLERRTIARFCSHYAEMYEAQLPKITRRDDECPVCGEPTQTASGELTGNPHLPDCDYLKPPYPQTQSGVAIEPPDIIPPWKGGNAHDEQPDFLRLSEMAPTCMNLLDWRQNGFEQRIGELEAQSLPVRVDTLEERLEAIAWWAGISYFHDESGKLFIPDGLQARLVELSETLINTNHEQVCHAQGLKGIEARLSAIEDWADIRYLPNEQGDYVTNNCIHDLVAEGMTGVTADMHKHLERLTVRIDTIGDVLIKALQSIDALESKTPC